jgi:hypothetical protein
MSAMSPYAKDSLSWLRRCYSDFEERPGDMEKITLTEAPIDSSKYHEAPRAL